MLSRSSNCPAGDLLAISVNCCQCVLSVYQCMLPFRKSDQEKVMREAVSLARLDHPKIVRYYTSWIEKAPPGWSENELWAALKSSESM